MEWTDLRAQWQALESATTKTPERPPLTARLWHSIRHRDRLETGAGLLTAAAFIVAAALFALAGEWMTVGFALYLVGCIALILVKLHQVRQQIPMPDPEVSVLAFLRAEHRALESQAKMMSTTFIWYWGPIAVGVIGFFTSLRGFDLMALAYALVVFFIGFWIEALNRAAVRKQIKPALKWVAEQVTQLEEEQ